MSSHTLVYIIYSQKLSGEIRPYFFRVFALEKQVVPLLIFNIKINVFFKKIDH